MPGYGVNNPLHLKGKKGNIITRKQYNSNETTNHKQSRRRYDGRGISDFCVMFKDR